MPRTPLLMLLVFALTLFASATLLFLVEPMIGKMITPLLGGTPAVWNTCMVFFQAVLLVGYTYAHLSTTWLGARKQAVLHLVLLLVPFVALPIVVNRGLIHGDENPVLLVLLILSLSVGLPMFVVSASAPLLQKWFANTSHPAARDPYFLYGASNLGSMLALIAYPTVVEPHLRLAQQSFDWTVGYGLLVALTAVCAVFLWLSPPAANKTVAEEAAPSTTAAHSSEAIQPSRQRVTTGRVGHDRLSKVHGQQHGGGHRFPFGYVKLTLAFHGSVLPDGTYGGNPCGFLIAFNDGTRVYDAADTGLFGDMRLIGEEGLDLAVLPIGDNYTMGPDDALRAVKLLAPRRVVPIHFNTWELIAQDAGAWAERVRRETKAEPVVLEPGEWLDVKAAGRS